MDCKFGMNICHFKKQHAANMPFVQGHFSSIAQNLSRCECSQALASVDLLHSLLVILSTQDDIFPAFPLLSSYLSPRSTTSKVLRQNLTLLRRHPSITTCNPQHYPLASPETQQRTRTPTQSTNNNQNSQHSSNHRQYACGKHIYPYRTSHSKRCLQTSFTKRTLQLNSRNPHSLFSLTSPHSLAFASSTDNLPHRNGKVRMIKRSILPPQFA